MKLLVTSDTHLSDRIWKHRPIEGDSYYSWHQIVDLAIAQESDAIILAGDLLDKQTNTSKAIKELTAGLLKLSDNHVEIYFNQGQHEYQEVPWMSLGDDVAYWLEGDAIKTQTGWTITGSDFKNSEGLMEFLQSEKAVDADILVCHQVWLEFMGELCKPQGSFADIPASVRYLITGDYHESLCQKFGELTVISPGSTHLRSISEPEDKYVYSMVLPTKGQPTITSLPLRTRRVIDIKVDQNTEFKTLAGQVEAYLAMAADYASEFGLPEHIAKPLMRLTCPQTAVELSNQVTKLVADRAHLFYKQVKFVSPDSLEPELNQHIDASERVGMLNCLDTYLDKKKQPATHALATRLLQAPDPDQALARWVKEQL